jgi:molecular chaperone GrpE
MNVWSDNEEILSRFRQWLDETRSEVAGLEEGAPADREAAGDVVGLRQLVEQFTALRHEVKLLTKAARSGEEQKEAVLLSMQAAIEQFRSVQADEAQAAHKAARPLVETLVELDESLVRGRRVIETARRRVLQEAAEELKTLRQRLDDLYRTQPWWRRALCRPWHQAAKDLYGARALDIQRNIFDSLLEGYDLIQTRLQRAMRQHSIVRMECEGRQTDPNTMTVLEVVSDPGRPAGMVVEEVRPGYYWNDKVLRFAEVKAAGKS